MRFEFRGIAGHTLNLKINEGILEELEVELVENKIKNYKFNGLNQILRVKYTRIPKLYALQTRGTLKAKKNSLKTSIWC